MHTFGNILWLIFGGWVIALEYFLASIPFFISIIGIPFGVQSIKLGVLAIWPIGSKVVTVEDTSGCLNLIMNIIWIIIGGIPIALSHLVLGVLICITIIGIPFGLQHFKFIKLALFPFGKQVIEAN